MSNVEKIIISIVVGIFMIALSYLIYISCQYDIYTFSSKNKTINIIYSSEGTSFNDGADIYDTIYECESLLKDYGKSVKVIKAKDKNKLDKKVNRAKSQVVTNIIININTTKLIQNKDTILLKVPKDDVKSIDLAAKIKNNTSNIKVNMIQDKNIIPRASNEIYLNIFLSHNCSQREGEELLTKIFQAMYDGDGYAMTQDG